MQGVEASDFEYAIDKPTLAAMCDMRGMVVIGGELDGKVFVGFAGRRLPRDRDDGLFHGVLRYREPESGEHCDTITFDELLGADAHEVTAKTAEPEIESED